MLGFLRIFLCTSVSFIMHFVGKISIYRSPAINYLSTMHFINEEILSVTLSSKLCQNYCCCQQPSKVCLKSGWWFHSSCSIQVCLDCSLVSLLPSSNVHSQLPRAGLQSFQPPTSPFGQPLQTEYSAVLAPGLFQSPVRRFGTHCLIRCVIRPSSDSFKRDL